jgi:hypothetical protein
VAPWLWLDHHLAAWQRAPDPERASWARQMLRRAVIVSAVVLVAASMHHVVSLAGGGRPAGLGTAWSPWP